MLPDWQVVWDLESQDKASKDKQEDAEERGNDQTTPTPLHAVMRNPGIYDVCISCNLFLFQARVGIQLLAVASSLFDRICSHLDARSDSSMGGEDLVWN